MQCTELTAIAKLSKPSFVTAAGMISLAGPMLAWSFAGRSLAASNLTVVSTQTWLASAFVHSFAFAIMQARDDTFR